MRLDDPYINYIIISAFQSKEDDFKNRLESSRLYDQLLFKDFTVVSMGGEQPSYLAYKEDYENDDLRYDAIELMDNFKQQYVIVKYKGEEESKKILFDGQEELLGLVEYRGEETDYNFFVEGKAFSFEPRKRYINPSNISDFKEGMVVEIKNNHGQWVQKKVIDPEVEYERMYKILMKYNKIRIEHNGDHLKS